MGRLIRPLPDGGRHQLLVIFPHFERVEFKSSDTVTADYAGIPGEKCRTAKKKPCMQLTATQELKKWWSD